MIAPAELAVVAEMSSGGTGMSMVRPAMPPLVAEMRSRRADFDDGGIALGRGADSGKCCNNDGAGKGGDDFQHDAKLHGTELLISGLFSVQVRMSRSFS